MTAIEGNTWADDLMEQLKTIKRQADEVRWDNRIARGFRGSTETLPR